jgi:hypothetical protein
MYVWDDAASQYKILGNVSFGVRDLGQNVFSPGQGFFVKAKDNTGVSVRFATAMQVHQTGTALKSAEVSWPGFELTAAIGQIKASTVVAFNNQMTKGLDPTYDAGLLRGTSGLNLYSRLVEDNGVDFAIQCLPETYDSLIIPIGLESKTGGGITFSAETVNLPTECKVIFEDKLTGTYTSLDNGASYQTTVASGVSGTGRFYIHTSNLTTGNSSSLSNECFKLKAYPSKGEIIIEVEVGNQAQVSLFDIEGRKLGQYQLQGGNRNTIPSTLASGVYLLNVTEPGKSFNTKIVIY